MRIKKKILLVEDEKSLSYLISERLAEESYQVVSAYDGNEALQLFQKEKPDLVLLDVMLPKLDGFEVLKTIRNTDTHTPIIFLTARIQPKDAVKGIEWGANDYIRKPFSMDELLVRIKLQLYGTDTITEIGKEEYQIGKFTLNTKTLILAFEESQKKLTHKEAAILELLIDNRNKVLSKRSILYKIWLDDSYFHSRTLDVFISRLRKYLNADNSIEISNIRGVGYILKC
ncbi:response regulator transcription factor [Peijinzhouia sedimentorum]